MNLDTGDFVRIKKDGKIFEGLVMPSTEFTGQNIIVLKLKNGYNVGIDLTNAKYEIIKKKEKLEEKSFSFSFDKSKPKISIFSTGGTIASKVEYGTGAVKALMKPEELIGSIPELYNFVCVESTYTPFLKMSEDLCPKDWILLAKEVSKVIQKVDGIIIFHGTDTMHFTSAALSFMISCKKPIILTGAQRSSDRPSSDAAMNVICSAIAATKDLGETAICMHATMSDDFCYVLRGTKVRKMHSSRRDAFRPINCLPLAKVFPDGKFEKISEYVLRDNTADVKLDAVFEEKTAILKTYPGASPEIIDFYLEKGYKGLVLEGTGLGHVPTRGENSWIKNIEKAIKEGCVVAITTQTLYGRTHPSVYENLRILSKTGAVFCEDMLPETAYVKLGWLLGHNLSPEEVCRKMRENLRGEISERSIPESFLF
ncbi:MAG: Glu-tRNA(Gln) amidotransferase subunit GatD [archaeon]